MSVTAREKKERQKKRRETLPSIAALLWLRSGSVKYDRQRFAAFLRVHHLHRHRLPLGETADSRRRQNGDMDKYIFAAVVGLNESEAFGLVKPLHFSSHGHSARRIGRLTARTRAVKTAAATKTAATRGRRRGAFGGSCKIDFKHTSDLLTLDRVGHLNLQLGSGRQSFIARGLNSADVEKGVARSVAELDEAEAFVGLEPFDDRVDRGLVGNGRR